MKFGLLPIMGVPALKPSFGGGVGGMFIHALLGHVESSPPFATWQSKIIYHLVLSNELRGESSYLGESV